jgi:hypothetical protein
MEEQNRTYLNFNWLVEAVEAQFTKKMSPEEFLDYITRIDGKNQ